MILLRHHQELAIRQVRESIISGRKRPIIAAPTSFGKTIVAGSILKSCQDKGKKGFFFCDRIQLIEQSIATFKQMGIDFGVRQSEHELSNPGAPIQICSIQTIAAMVNKHGRYIPDFDLAIVDEAHSQYSIIKDIIGQFNNVPIIGLTATPYSKGLGKLYNNLLVPIEPRELLNKGYLCPVKYFGGAHIDMSKIGSKNPNEFKSADINRETKEQSGILVGCIIDNWLKHGENSQTIAFSPTKAHSRDLVRRFIESGISAEHIDCDFSQEDRQALFEAHDKGEFKVLSCSRLLNTGYDAPRVRCVIDCFPTKSVTTWVQRAGRIMRLSEGKEYAIYLDHASNFERFGYPEDIVPDHLDTGDKTTSERELTREKKEVKTCECPKCYQLMSGIVCKACGNALYARNTEVLDDGSDLVELGGKAANKTISREVKERFYGDLIMISREKGYKVGWAANKYKQRFGVWPNKISANVDFSSVSEDTRKWLKHDQIRWAKGMKKYA
jgi:superfamily II DNA or RNA helicase